TEFSLVMRDKTEHFVRSFVPDNPKAILILIHGKGEHGGRYTHFGNELEKNGYAVYVPDLRGHGKTRGRIGHTAPRNTILDDVDEIILYAKIRHPDLPVFIYGHSMGGNIILNYRHRRPDGIKAFIASAPWLYLVKEFSAPLKKFVIAFSKLLPNTAISTGIDATVITSIEAEQKEYLKDKKINGVITAATVADVFVATNEIFKYAPTDKTPFLLLHGDDDRLVDVNGSRKLAKLSGELCSYKEYKANRHEILHDISRDDAINDMLFYLEAQLTK
ncbi:MAG: lysophospholipase, partial [Clostridia bacterium]|nr:lysophospholipase [Clostridia bacterium]